MIELIPDLYTVWIAVHNQAINAQAYINKINWVNDKLQLTFPANSQKAEELNCIMLGIDYQVIPNHSLQTYLTVTPKTTTNNKLLNFTELEYSIDRSKPLLAFIEEISTQIEIVEQITKANQIVINEDRTINCSPNLIAKPLKILGTMVYKRWIQELYEQVYSISSLQQNNYSKNSSQTPIKTYKKIDKVEIYFLNQKYLQALQGQIVPIASPNNNHQLALLSPFRTITFTNVRQLSVTEPMKNGRTNSLNRI